MSEEIVTVKLGTCEFVPLTCRTEDLSFYHDHVVGLITPKPKAFAEVYVEYRQFLTGVDWLHIIKNQVSMEATIEALEEGVYDHCVVEIQVDEIIVGGGNGQ